MQMKVLIADDEPKVRSALRLLLEQESEWQIVGEVGDAKSLFSDIQVVCPDVVLLDWELPGIDLKNRVTELKKYCPKVKIVALSSQVNARKTAHRAKIDRFISKGHPPDAVLSELYSLYDCLKKENRGSVL